MERTIYQVDCDGPGPRGIVCRNTVTSTWSEKDARKKAEALGWSRTKASWWTLSTFTRNVCPACQDRLRGQEPEDEREDALKVTGFFGMPDQPGHKHIAADGSWQPCRDEAACAREAGELS